ncbi:hypothetical protein FEF34_37645 [Streptomyces marianii]|uniref:Uncharacterized protein n=1 Tax=Streptomyces marianii TaxID=1817406 RepID=A0A5R9ECZ3_9ACTN|nr:hypothetical protein FEF34_37645 [Streptomyces marianii]
MPLLRWTTKSLRNLAGELTRQGHSARPGGPYRFPDREVKGCVGEVVVGLLIGLADAAPGQRRPHPVGELALVVELGDGRQPHRCSVVDMGPFAPLPGFVWGLRGQALVP